MSHIGLQVSRTALHNCLPGCPFWQVHTTRLGVYRRYCGPLVAPSLGSCYRLVLLLLMVPVAGAFERGGVLRPMYADYGPEGDDIFHALAEWQVNHIAFRSSPYRYSFCQRDHRE